MSVTVSILYSPSADKYYIGQMQILDQRLEEHNTGQSKLTKSGKPWILVYQRCFDNRSEAMRYESYLKRMKNRRFIQDLIQSG